MSDNAMRLPKDKELIPRALIRAMVFLIFATVGLVAYAKWTDQPLAGQPPGGEVVAERMIAVDVKPRGAATVYDEDGVLIREFAEGEAGFMDSIFRAVAYERKKSGASADGPVSIARLDTGRHILVDPNTGWTMQLIGYGAKNVEPFVQLLADM